MYLGKQGENIVSVSENREELEAVKDIAGFTSIDETDEIVEKVGTYYLVGAEAINEARRKLRAQAYLVEKDPITCHIQSLKDEEQTPETIEEIELLKQERSEVVEAIKERYPYVEE